MKRSKLNPISKKRSAGLVRYAKAKREYLEEHTVCEVCFKLGPTDIHHKKSRLGSLLWNKKYFMAVCRCCHDLIHKHPMWAASFGFSLDRLAK